MTTITKPKAAELLADPAAYLGARLGRHGFIAAVRPDGRPDSPTGVQVCYTRGTITGWICYPLGRHLTITKAA